MSEERVRLRELTDVDRVIHEPARLLIIAILYAADQVDFLYLLRETGLTRGNLSTHLSRLEQAAYVKVEKTFRGKMPHTLISLTPNGKLAFETYRKQINQIMSDAGAKPE
jgi:DNA-binding MarR family transcriptional regulator